MSDTKLARSAKVEALLQLAAYADALAGAACRCADEVELVLGDGTVARYRVDELIPVYRPRAPNCSGCSTTTTPRTAPVRWDGRRRAGVLPLPGVHRAGARAPTTCCWSPACGSASGPG